MNAPKGVGSLYFRIIIEPFIDGGSQRKNRERGTEIGTL